MTILRHLHLARLQDHPYHRQGHYLPSRRPNHPQDLPDVLPPLPAPLRFCVTVKSQLERALCRKKPTTKVVNSSLAARTVLVHSSNGSTSLWLLLHVPLHLLQDPGHFPLHPQGSRVSTAQNLKKKRRCVSVTLLLVPLSVRS